MKHNRAGGPLRGIWSIGTPIRRLTQD